MSHIHRIRRIVGVLTGLAAAVVAAVAVAPAAFAAQVPPGPLSRYEQVVPATKHPPVPAHAVSIGMPGWQIALIAVGAAIVAAALAVLFDRLWAARRHPTPTHA
jgi:hypothetical protein